MKRWTVGLAIVVIVDCAGPADAETVRAEYDLTHAFDLTLPEGSEIHSVEWLDFQHAYATALKQITITVGPPPVYYYRPKAPQSYDVGPKPQPTTFNGFVGDGLTRNGLNVHNGATNANVDRIEIAPTGASLTRELDDVVRNTPDNSSAFARSRVDVDPWTSDSISGAVHVDGFGEAVASTKKNDAYAYSSSVLKLEGQLGRGTVDWRPNLAGALEGKASVRAYHDVDPIVFVELDPVTGEEIGTIPLWQFAVEKESDVYYEYDSINTQELTVNGQDGALTIFLSDYTSMPGRADVQFKNGVIVKSFDTGVFEGLFPEVGLPANFTVPMPQINFEYDLGPTGQNAYGFLVFGGAGGDEPIPEPSTVVTLGGLLGMGLIGYGWRTRKRMRIGRS
jgi:hypothetical protein